MKKFFSLLCATLLVFSASAAPVAKKAELVKKAPVAVEQMQSVQFEKAQTLNLNQLSATPALTVSNQKAEAPAVLGKKVVKADHNATPAVSAAPAKAPKAVMADSIVTAVDWYYDDYYYDVYVYAENTTYLFELLESTDGLTYGTTYKYADMYADWVCTLTSSGSPDITATDATLTVTKDEAGLIHIAATMVLNGVNHIISYDEKPFVPSGVQIPLNGTELSGKYMSYYGMYVYTAKVGANEIQLAFDATAEQETYTADQLIADYCVYASPDYSTYVEFVKAASDFTVNTTEKTKTLTGSIYADNGDEYILNLVYEKPDAKYIDINVADAALTNKSVAGFWTIGGQTEDKIYDCNIYFISKALQGTWTDVTKFDAYSTWVSDKSSGSNVYYENLSEVNLTSAVVGDSLVVTGTLSLADYNGNPAIVTVYITTPFTQEWGEWADFAPFEKNTGKYTFATLGEYTQVGIQVLERKDNTGLKQYNLKNWGKGYFDGVGQDLVLNMNPDYTFTFVSNPVNVGADVVLADVATAFGDPSYASLNSYNPETGVFSFYTAVVFASSGQIYTAKQETFVMDKPITERDTVNVTADMKILAEPTKGIIKVSAEHDSISYILEVVGADTVGTFSLADGTLSQKYYYGIVSDAGRSDFAEGEVTIAKNETGLKLNGLMIGADEKAYVLDWTYTPITERDTVNFSGKGVTISECVNSQTGVQTGWFYELTDASTGYEFLLQSTVVDNKFGNFSYADGTLGKNYYNVYAPDGSRQQFVEGSISVGEVGDSIVLDGELIAEDEKVYILHFAQNAAVLNYDTDAPFEYDFAWRNMSASMEEGEIEIYVNNGTEAMELVLFTDTAATEIPAGTYVVADTEEVGTALQSVGVEGGYLQPCWAGTVAATGGISDCWFLVEGTVTLSYDSYGKLAVEVAGKNSYGQDIIATIKYEKLNAIDTVTVADATFSLYEDYMEQYGLVEFFGSNEEVTFDLYAYADTLFGDFTESIDLGDCELYAANGVLAAYDANLLEVTADGKNMTLKAEVLGSDTVLYVITATGYLGALDYDSNEDYAGEFAIEEVTFSQQKAKKLVTITGTNDAEFVIVLQNATLTNDVLAAGEYTDVQASTGVNEDYSVNPSYAMDAEGAAWFIQSGKLTVAEDGSMLFEGLNSYDKNVVITVTVPAPVTDYYLVGWINNAAYGIEGDIDNFGDYKFVAGEDGALKVKATFNEMSYVQVKDNNKQIYGTESYVAPVAEGASAVVLATGIEKMGIDGNVEFEYTLTIAEDGTMTLSYAPTATGLNNIKANVKAAKHIANGQIVIVRDNKEYNILGTAL